MSTHLCALLFCEDMIHEGYSRREKICSRVREFLTVCFPELWLPFSNFLVLVYFTSRKLRKLSCCVQNMYETLPVPILIVTFEKTFVRSSKMSSLFCKLDFYFGPRYLANTGTHKPHVCVSRHHFSDLGDCWAKREDFITSGVAPAADSSSPAINVPQKTKHR